MAKPKAKGKGKKGAGKDPHAPFDKVTLKGPGGEEHDVTNVFNGEAFDLDGEGPAIPLFPESKDEKDARRAFYDTTPAKSDEDVDFYTHSISVGGSLSLKEKLNNCERVTVTIANADGTVIAAGEADISVGFSPHFTKEANIMERTHKAKLR